MAVGVTEELLVERVLMDSTQEMVFIVKVDRSGNFFYEFLNQEAINQTALDASAIGRSVREVHSPEIGKRMESHYRQAAESAKKLKIEEAFQLSTGEVRWYQMVLTPLLNGQEECTHVSAFIREVTKERKADQDALEMWKQIEESRSRYSSLYENNTDAVFTLDLKGRILEGNQTAANMTEFLIDELKDKRFLDYVIAEDPEKFRDYLDQALSTPLEDTRIRFLANNGSQISCLLKLVPIIVGGNRVGIYAILKDMTELDKMAGKFAESENLFQIIAENAHDVIILLNNSGQFMYISPSSFNVYGATREEIEAEPLLSLVHPEETEELDRKLSESILTGELWKMQLRIKHKTRGWVWSELLGTPVFDEDGKFSHKVLLLRDISKQKEYESKLEFFAYHDALTGLPNRRMLKEAMYRKIEHDEEFAVLILDIDDFKEINDGWGHEIGDQVIQEFAHRLSQNIGEHDLAARLGGDEFVLLYKGPITSAEAIQKASIIRRSMEISWEALGVELKITTSIGIHIASADASNPSDVLKKADHALYEAKNAGKNNFQLNR